MIPPVGEWLSNGMGVGSPLVPFAKVWPNQAPKGTIGPYLVWQVVSGFSENYLDEAPTMDWGRVQVVAYASTLGAARDLMKRARAVLEQHGTYMSGPRTSYEPDANLHSLGVDFSIWHVRE